MTASELKKLRRSKKLSRRELGQLLAASPRTVEGWEQGRDPIPQAKQKFIRLVLATARR
jgi:DNA-binding transcriptional regulator YiaG